MSGLKLYDYFRDTMGGISSLQPLVAIMLVCLLTSGCLGLAMQREIIEDYREPPEVKPKPERFGWDHTFHSESASNTIFYSNSTTILFDESVSNLEITFLARFPYSSQWEEIFGNETNEIRYVEVKLWQEGDKSTGEPFWEVRATQDTPQTVIDFGRSELKPGIWDFEVEARGYGWTAPIDLFSSHDSFEVYATITRPCIRFPETHSADECTFISELGS